MQSPLINVMTAAALKASKGLLRDFGEVDNLQVSRKGASTFVTNADTRTEKLLHKELSIARPDFGFLMEEGGEIAGKDGVHRFIIDPLDGTSNFIHAVPYFCISIALEKREANGNTNIIAGVIYDPIHNEMFTAEQYKGAFLNNRRLVVSGRDKMADAMFASSGTKTLKKLTPTEQKTYQNLATGEQTIRRLGATALDLAYIAAGRLDGGFYTSIESWDIAAGMLMVQEAGGKVMDLSGNPANCYSRTLVACNGSLSSSVQSLVAKAA